MSDTPALEETPAEVTIHDDVPSTEEELQARNDLLSATVLILQEESEAATARAERAEEEVARLRVTVSDDAQAEVRRLHRLIYCGTISPEVRNASRIALGPDA